MKELIKKWNEFVEYANEENDKRKIDMDRLSVQTGENWTAYTIEHTFSKFMDWLQHNERKDNIN